MSASGWFASCCPTSGFSRGAHDTTDADKPSTIQFAGVAHGRQTHRFFEKLIRGGFATTDLAAPAHAGRIYHVQYKPWYRLLGEPDHRHRKAMSVGRAVDPSTSRPGIRSGQGA